MCEPITSVDGDVRTRDRGRAVRVERRHIEAEAHADLVADERTSRGAAAFIDDAIAVVVDAVADLGVRGTGRACEVDAVAVFVDPVAADLRPGDAGRACEVDAVAVFVDPVAADLRARNARRGADATLVDVEVTVVVATVADFRRRGAGREANAAVVDHAIAIVVAAVADFRRRGTDAGAGEIAPAAVLIYTVAADFRRTRVMRRVAVIAVVADRVTEPREGASERSVDTHRHEGGAVVIGVEVAALVDEAVAVVVEVVADLHARGRTDCGATVVDDAVAIVVDCIGTDFRNRPIGNRAAERRHRRAHWARADAVMRATADSDDTLGAAAKARGRGGDAGASRVETTLLSAGIRRAEVRR